MKKLISSILLTLVGTGVLTSSANAALAVNWGGDYVTATKKYRNTDGATSSTAEFGDDGLNDDSVRRFAYSETNELNPPIAAGSYSGTSDRFYGGLEEFILDSLNPTTGVSAIPTSTGEDVQNNAAGDRNTLIQSNSANARSYGAWVWDKADFLNGLDSAANLGFDSTSSLSVTIAQNNTGSGGTPHFKTRFMVKDGAQWYLSNTFNGAVAPTTFTLSGAALTGETWALYDPMTDLQANPGVTSGLTSGGAAEQLTYAPHTFADITFLGFYSESSDNNGTGDRNFQWNAFSADVVPEPTTVAMLLSGLGTLLVLRRHR